MNKARKPDPYKMAIRMKKLADQPDEKRFISFIDSLTTEESVQIKEAIEKYDIYDGSIYDEKSDTSFAIRVMEALTEIKKRSMQKLLKNV